MFIDKKRYEVHDKMCIVIIDCPFKSSQPVTNIAVLSTGYRSMVGHCLRVVSSVPRAKDLKFALALHIHTVHTF